MVAVPDPRTDFAFRPQIRTRHHTNGQIVLHLANNLDRVVELQMRILWEHISHARVLRRL